MAKHTLTLSQAFSRAISAYNAGNLVEAEQLCQQIINAKSDIFDALHLLAVVQSSLGKKATALSSFDRALKVRPDSAVALFNRGGTLHDLKRFAEALASYDRALKVRPDFAEAYFNRGITLQALKRLAEALASYDRALKMRPDYAEALSNRGVALQELKRFEEALASFDRALTVRPDYAEALSNRGNTLKELQRFEEALASYDRVLTMRPNYAEALYNRGNILKELQRFAEALASYDRALTVRPDFAEALSNRGNVLKEVKRFAEALASYDRALTVRPDFPEAQFNRGVTLHELKRFEEALASYERALAMRPDYAEALCNRGVTLHHLKRFAEALPSYDRALTVRPDYAEALCNRGNTLQELTRFAEALASYDRALTVRPDYAEALSNRGNTLKELMRFEEALASFDRALAVRPDYAEALSNRGVTLLELTRFEEALASYDRALTMRPDYAEAHFNRGVTLQELARLEEALASYEKAIALKPDYGKAEFALCMAELPILYMDEPEIIARRTAYERRLRALCDAVDRSTNLAELAQGVGSSQPFYLSYQGYNDRDLQALYGSFVCRLMAKCYPPAALAPPPGETEPVRVGIVSGLFRRHTVWKLLIKGWLSQLDRRRFRIFGYHTAVWQDAETKAAAALCDRFVQGPKPIDGWRAEILADAPHVLIYPEVGMDHVAVTLAAQRLAAVQCNSWGHPDTSGFPTLDYYLSSDLMEPGDGQDHYTERLVRLPNLSIYYEPIDAQSASITRQDLGLRSTAIVYWCCQSLYKYLPQFDEVFPRIARAVGDCQFAFIQYQKGAHVTELFRQRLNRAFGALGLKADDHCLFLPPLAADKFIAASGQCDVFLDSINWSGGNTTLESLLHDLPIVTMTGPLMRGRHSTAILRMMGVTETIAETIDDYVSIAVRLARDVPWRMAVKAKISASKHRIYFDSACISGLEQFLNHAVRENGSK
jgi:protein O-GlcNAc transferase